MCIQKRLFEKKVQNILRITQLQTFIRVLKDEEVHNIATLDELYNWCITNENLP